MEFSEQSYVQAVLTGACAPPGVMAPFINVDRARYHKLKNETERLDVEPLRKRLNDKYFGRARGALGLTLKYAQTFFPAYRFLANEFLNDEWLATVDWHKFHRDHAVHQSMTAYVGMTLLESKMFSADGKIKLIDLFADAVLDGGGCGYLHDFLSALGRNSDRKIDPSLWRLMIKDTFFLAALFHDMGYPWRFVNIIHDKLGPHGPGDSPAGRNADWLAEHYGHRLLFLPLNGYMRPGPAAPANWPERRHALIEKALAKTHGMPGAISFLHLNDILRVFPDERAVPERLFCLEWAAMAIMMHDMAGIYGKVDIDEKGAEFKVDNPQMRLKFSRDPLSWMLTLCDLIQEFGRPDADFTRPNSGDKYLNVSYHSRCECVSLDRDDNDVLTIMYHYNNYGDFASKKGEFIPKEQLLYFDPARGYLDFSGLGVKRVKLNAVYEEKP